MKILFPGAKVLLIFDVCKFRQIFLKKFDKKLIQHIKNFCILQI